MGPLPRDGQQKAAGGMTKLEMPMPTFPPAAVEPSGLLAQSPAFPMDIPPPAASIHIPPDPLAATPPLLVGHHHHQHHQQLGIVLLAQQAVEEPSSTTGESPEDEASNIWEERSRLMELKVQELKSECKKRQLAVSGSKQQLMDRLRPFEWQILTAADLNNNNGGGGCDSGKNFCSSSSPSAAYSPSQTAAAAAVVGSSSAVIDAVIDSVIDGRGLVEGKKKSGTANKKRQLGKCKQQQQKLDWRGGHLGGPLKAKQGNKKERKLGQQKGTLAELLRGSTAQQMMAALGGAAAPPKQMLLGGGKKGCACGDSNTLEPNTAKGWKSVDNMSFMEEEEDDQQQQPQAPPLVTQPHHQLVVSSSPPNLAAPAPMANFEAMTFSFAQMGSGGQFTPMEPANIHIGIPVSNEGSPVPQQQPKCEGAAIFSKQSPPSFEPILLPSLAERSAQIQKGPCHCKHPPQQPLSATPQMENNNFVACSPFGGENLGSCQPIGSRRRHSTQVAEMVQVPATAAPPAAWPDPAGELMSAATLARHEEMLRQQQRRILELQRDLGRSQLGLQQHQQMLAEARRAALPRDPDTGRLLGQVDFWLGQLEATRQLERTHRDQLQLLDRQVAGHRALVGAEQRLQEELHTEQAVQDICRLIRQEPKAALLIVQLLRRYQLERNVPPPPPATSVVEAPPQPTAPVLWNGILPQPQQQMDIQHCPVEDEASPPPATTKSRAQNRKRAMEPKGAKGPGAKRAAPQGRSNSVLDGLTTGGGGAKMQRKVATAACICAGQQSMTVAGGGRRPNSSLGTESGGGRHQQRRDGGPGPVDMEEIFRSVLEDGGAAARQKDSLASVPEFVQCSPGSQMATDAQFLADQLISQGQAAMFTLPTATAEGQQSHHSQEMEKTMQDLMEVLRDDQEKGHDCPSSGADDFQTDQLATFLAEEVELCRNASRTAFSASAVLPAQGQAVASEIIRLGQAEDQCVDASHMVAQGFGGPSPADLLLFPGEETDRALDWLDGFDSFTAVF